MSANSGLCPLVGFYRLQRPHETWPTLSIHLVIRKGIIALFWDYMSVQAIKRIAIPYHAPFQAQSE